MDFSKILFRASSCGHLMTDPRSKADKDAGNLSEGAKTHLVDVYVQNKYNRQTDIHNKYVAKGLMVEEDSITLYSRVKKAFFKKNEKHLSNEFLKGTPDLFTGLEIEAADRIIDIKSSWDIFTFFRNLSKGYTYLYYWQLQAYMALTCAAEATLAFCLVDTPETLIEDAKRKLMWAMNAGTTENEDYKAACVEIERSMTFGDIPMHERVIEFSIQRSQADINALYARVQKAREYLNTLEKTLNPTAHDKEVKEMIVEEIKLTKLKTS